MLPLDRVRQSGLQNEGRDGEVTAVHQSVSSGSSSSGHSHKFLLFSFMLEPRLHVNKTWKPETKMTVKKINVSGNAAIVGSFLVKSITGTRGFEFQQQSHENPKLVNPIGFV